MTYQETSVEFPFHLDGPLVVERPKGSGTFVRLADDVKKCVVYLGIPNLRKDAPQDMKPGGTGFIVRYGDPSATYIVTAAHVAKRLKDRTFGVRLNREDNGEAQIHMVEGDSVWHDHPDDLVDVSVLPFEIPEWSDAIPFQSFFATEFKRKTKDFGSGDMVYIVGVYKFLYGKKRNMPAVHVGHIASMADGEEILTRDWKASNHEEADPVPIYGHLVQVATLPGSSGSPVFVRRSLFDPMLEYDQEEIKHKINAWKYGSVWLLGLWHGNWGDPEKLVQLPNGEFDIGMNMGIVIPAPKIVEALELPELVKMRKESAMTKIDPQSIAIPQSDDAAERGDAILRAGLNTSSLSKPKRKGKRKASRARVSSK